MRLKAAWRPPRALFGRSGAAAVVLAVAMVGLGGIGAWADEPTEEPDPTLAAPAPAAETPLPPAPPPADAPALAPGAEVEAGPMEPREAGSGGPTGRPIGSTDPSSVTDISAFAGITSGDADGLLVPAPPQRGPGLEPVIEGGRTGPDPIDIAMLG